jgi:hypothetical protein
MRLDKAPLDGTSSYVLADSDGHHLTDSEGSEFRYDTEAEARQEVEAVSLETDLPVSEIVLLIETREEIKL